jgi:hypothetical protein
MICFRVYKEGKILDVSLFVERVWEGNVEGN